MLQEKLFAVQLLQQLLWQCLLVPDVKKPQQLDQALPETGSSLVILPAQTQMGILVRVSLQLNGLAKTKLLVRHLFDLQSVGNSR